MLCFAGAALASTHQLSAKRMADCWEAFSLTKNIEQLTSHTFQAYRNELIKDSEVAVAPTAVQTRNAQRMVTPPTAKRQKTDPKPTTTSSSSVDSVANNAVSSPKRPPPMALPKYNDRTRVGQVVASYHAETLPPMKTEASSTRTSPRCQVSTQEFETNVDKPYRYMFTTMEERAAALENHLKRVGNEIIDTYGISNGDNGIAPLEQVNVPRQDKICCVGRVCNEVSYFLNMNILIDLFID